MLVCICVVVSSCSVSANDVGYDEMDILSDTNYEYYEDMTYADWSEYCTEEPIYTELYSVNVPESWRDICKYDILGSGLGIDFLVRSPDGDNVPLCTLNVYLDGALLNNYDLLGTAKDTYGTSYSLIATYPGDIQWEDDYEREIFNHRY